MIRIFRITDFNLFNHLKIMMMMPVDVFSDELSVEEIIQSYLGIDIRNKPLKRVLGEMAAAFDTHYSNTQPTYAAHSIFYLKKKFEYLTNRVILLYDLDENKTSIVKTYFWEMTEALQKLRNAINPWPDYQLRHTTENHSIKNYSNNEQTREQRWQELLHQFCFQTKVVGWFSKLYFNGLVNRYPCQFLFYTQKMTGKRNDWRKEESKRWIKESINQRIDTLLSMPLERHDGDIYELFVKKLDQMIEERKKMD